MLLVAHTGFEGLSFVLCFSVTTVSGNETGNLPFSEKKCD